MAHSSNTCKCSNPLEQSMDNIGPEAKSDVKNMNDFINSFNKLQLVQTVDDLLTDDEDDLNSNITDDEEYFSALDSSIIEPAQFPTFTSLYKSSYESLSLVNLKEECSKLNFSITDSKAKEIEKLTRDQANSPEWHKLRQGRITASVFQSVCSTKVEKPSISLLKKLCYPETAIFTSKYTEWGRMNEKKALDDFVTDMKMRHIEFENVDSGLVVHPEYPYFGASPDGLCCCNCCGKGCIEIKCPYSLKDGEPLDVLLTKKSPFLIKNDGKYELNKKHAYYFQIQMQLFLTNRDYCYFVVWSPNNMLEIKVLPDKEFWLTHSAKAERFFKCVVLPELVGKYFSRQKTPLTSTTN